jgi:hypothetical protein
MTILPEAIQGFVNQQTDKLKDEAEDLLVKIASGSHNIYSRLSTWIPLRIVRRVDRNDNNLNFRFCEKSSDDSSVGEFDKKKPTKNNKNRSSFHELVAPNPTNKKKLKKNRVSSDEDISSLESTNNWKKKSVKKRRRKPEDNVEIVKKKGKVSRKMKQIQTKTTSQEEDSDSEGESERKK